MKQILTLLAFCLPISTAVFAEQEISTIATTQSPPTSLINPEPSIVSEQNHLADYQLAPGDALEISVWKEEGLQQQQILIAPDGTIIYPLIGTVIAAGKTITELNDALTSRLADYISEPSVSVKLLNNQGNAVFVIGKVNKPGQVFSSRRIDVLQALSLAGGLTVFADAGSINVQRRVGNEIKVFPFDYDDVIEGDDLQQNILLEPGDTVSVP